MMSPRHSLFFMSFIPLLVLVLIVVLVLLICVHHFITITFAPLLAMGLPSRDSSACSRHCLLAQDSSYSANGGLSKTGVRRLRERR